MIPIVETFYSFQGEGKYVGSPSIFVRFGGCNLKCIGFGVEIDGIVGCDSLKAVDKKRFSHTWRYVDDIIPLIKEYTKKLDFNPDIVFTGGEPLLHYTNPIFLNSLKYFKKHKITIETNATIDINFQKYPIYKNIIFAMSVKLKNSKELYEKRVNHKAIENIVKNSKDSFFKFVLSKDDLDKKEINDIVKKYKNCPVYCMPLGSTASELSVHDKEVAEFCIKNGYNFVDRMHIRLWDNQEGR